MNVWNVCFMCVYHGKTQESIWEACRYNVPVSGRLRYSENRRERERKKKHGKQSTNMTDQYIVFPYIFFVLFLPSGIQRVLPSFMWRCIYEIWIWHFVIIIFYDMEFCCCLRCIYSVYSLCCFVTMMYYVRLIGSIMMATTLTTHSKSTSMSPPRLSLRHCFCCRFIIPSSGDCGGRCRCCYCLSHWSPPQ